MPPIVRQLLLHAKRKPGCHGRTLSSLLFHPSFSFSPLSLLRNDSCTIIMYNMCINSCIQYMHNCKYMGWDPLHGFYLMCLHSCTTCAQLLCISHFFSPLILILTWFSNLIFFKTKFVLASSFNLAHLQLIYTTNILTNYLC
jgi:hypothetical protein